MFWGFVWFDLVLVLWVEPRAQPMLSMYFTIYDKNPLTDGCHMEI